MTGLLEHLRRAVRALPLALAMAVLPVGAALLLLAGPLAAQQQTQPAAGASVRPPAGATVPGGRAASEPERAGPYDPELWRKVRSGIEGKVSIPDKKAGVLVQSDGEAWRNFRNGPLAVYGSYAMGGMIALLVLFFLARGRIEIEHGWSGRMLVRFSTIDRMAHWLLAVSFIILGLTGLNILYGRYVVLPVVGKEAFAALAQLGKLIHNYVAFAFMAGLVLTFVLWVRHNVPGPRDLIWLLKGGGLLVKGSHPPAWKFNAGQKILFWLIILGGIAMSLTGLSLMFPFQGELAAKVFAGLNRLGFSFPAAVTAVQEMQLVTTWHSVVALFLVCVILGHIYIGTVGMQGAFSAMGSGEVDENWAKEHHSLWAEQELAQRLRPPPRAGGAAPAE